MHTYIVVHQQIHWEGTRIEGKYIYKCHPTQREELYRRRDDSDLVKLSSE